MMSVTYKISPSQVVVLKRTAEHADLPGVSAKEVYRDEQGNAYILKNVKHRSIASILGDEYASKLFQDYAALCTKAPDQQTILAQALGSVFKQDIFNVPISQLTETYLADLFAVKEKQLLSELTQLNNAQDIKKILLHVQNTTHRLKAHVNETLCNFMHTEILGPQLAKALWQNQVVVPETFYPEKYDPQNPQIISRFLKPEKDENNPSQRFIEFLQPKVSDYAAAQLELLRTEEQQEFIKKFSPKLFELRPFLIKSPAFWLELEKLKPNCRPRLEHLELEPFQKKIMGQVYAIALILGHADILNNIDSTNSGSMSGLPACVDWGNSFMIGFGGLSKEESFAHWNQNNEIVNLILQTDLKVLQKQWSDPQNYDLTSEMFSFPFIEQVFPYIPRLLVQDIFNINDKAIFEGFKEFVNLAYEHMGDIEKGYVNAWRQADSQTQKLLNKDWYSPEGEGPEIIRARLAQLKGILDNIPADCPDPQAFFQTALLTQIKSFIQLQNNSAYKPVL